MRWFPSAGPDALTCGLQPGAACTWSEVVDAPHRRGVSHMISARPGNAPPFKLVTIDRVADGAEKGGWRKAIRRPCWWIWRRPPWPGWLAMREDSVLLPQGGFRCGGRSACPTLTRSSTLSGQFRTGSFAGQRCIFRPQYWRAWPEFGQKQREGRGRSRRESSGVFGERELSCLQSIICNHWSVSWPHDYDGAQAGAIYQRQNPRHHAGRRLSRRERCAR